MIDRMGDKASAKATMIAAGVPCIPGSEGLLESYEQTESLADEMGLFYSKKTSKTDRRNPIPFYDQGIEK